MKQYLVVGLGEEKVLQVHLSISEFQDWEKLCLLVASTFAVCCNYRKHLYFENATLQAVNPQNQHEI